MAYDMLRKFQEVKDKYGSARGSMPGPRGAQLHTIPLTSAADVAVIGAAMTAAYKAVPNKTAALNRVYGEFTETLPPAKMGVTKWLEFANLIYAWNDQFWLAAAKLSIAINGAGMVPGRWDILVQSVSESTKELANKVGGVAKAALDSSANAIAKPLFAMADVLKWGTIATVVVGGLYYYGKRKRG